MSIESLPARIKSLWHRLLHGQQVDSDLEDEIPPALSAARSNLPFGKHFI